MTDVVFVCWGNICRSPMAERVARSYLAQHGLGDVRLTSAATSREEIGAPIDPRAARDRRARAAGDRQPVLVLLHADPVRRQCLAHRRDSVALLDAQLLRAARDRHPVREGGGDE